MPRRIINYQESTSTAIVELARGGTGATTATEALENLGGISKSILDQPNGLAVLDSSGKIKTENIPQMVAISGPTSIFGTETAIYTITDFDDELTYLVETDTGSVTLLDDGQIKYIAPSTAGTGGFTVNGRIFRVEIKAAYIVKPTITYPTNNGVVSTTDITVTLGAFRCTGVSDSHTATDWELATDSVFSNIVYHSYGDTTNLLSIKPTGLSPSGTYYIRARFAGERFTKSDWSDTTVFIIDGAYIITPSILQPTSNATEVSPEISFIATPISVNVTTDTHKSSDWQISTDSSFTSVVAEVSNSTTCLSTFTTSGLLYSTKYYVRVRYRGTTLGLSEWSVAVPFTTINAGINKPGISSPLAGATISSTTLSATSSAFYVTGIVDSHISSSWQLALDNAFTNIAGSVSKSSAYLTSWTVSELSPSTTYYLCVKHHGAKLGDSNWSDVISFTTASASINTPTITSPTNGSTGLSIGLAITGSDFATTTILDTHLGTDWQIATDSSFTNIVSSVTASTTSKVSYRPTGLEYGKTYYVRVRYKGNMLDYSKWSNVVSFSTLVAYIDTPSISSPTAKEVVNSTTVNFTSSSFSYTGVADSHLTSTWQLATDSAFTSVVSQVSQSSSNKTTWSVASLTPNTTYYARVRYHGSVLGYSGWSEVRQFSIGQAVVNAPSISSPSANSTGQDVNLTITSTAFSTNTVSDTHASSDWQLSLTSTFATLVSATTLDAINKTSWSVTGLNANTAYYVRVRHRGENLGVSSWSTVVSFTTASASVATPVITSPSSGATGLTKTLTITGSSFSTVTVTDTHTSSDWQVATDAGFSNIISTVTGSNVYKTTYTPSGLVYGTTYYVRVRYNGTTLGPSQWSSVVNFTTVIAYVSKPTLTSPVAGTVLETTTANLTSSVFGYVGITDTHLGTDWQIATDVNFTTIVNSTTNDEGNLTTWIANSLTAGRTYYARLRFNGTKLGYSSWSDVVSFSVASAYIATPSVTSPTTGSTGNVKSTNIVTSSFIAKTLADTHVATDYQIATDVNFVDIVENVTSTTALTNYVAQNLAYATTYYVRVRHKGSILGYSAWSSVISFTTIVAYANKPTITSPTSGSTVTATAVTIATTAFSYTGVSDTHLNTDWQIATDTAFTNIVKASLADTTNKTSWVVSGLSPSTTYYVRAKHRATNIPESTWSDVVSFSVATAAVNTPYITSPISGATGISKTPTFVGSAFATTTISDTHYASDWQVATDSSFTNIVSSTTSNTVSKTTYTPTGLSYNTTYYARVRYRGTTLGYSTWSSVIVFTTLAAYINQPTISSPTASATKQSPSLTITSNAFAYTGVADTHASTDWQISTDSSFINIVTQSLTDTVNKTSLTTSALSFDTTYYVRVRYNGTNLGASNWSTVVSFTTDGISGNTTVIASPINATTNTAGVLELSLESFITSTVVNTHVATDWMIATDSSFTTVIVNRSKDTVNLNSLMLTGLEPSTRYFVKARVYGHNATLVANNTTIESSVSRWSLVGNFTTKAYMVPTTEHTTFTNSNDSKLGISVALSGNGLVAAVESSDTVDGVMVDIYELKDNYWNTRASLKLGINVTAGQALALSSDGTYLATKYQDSSLTYLYKWNGSTYNLISTADTGTIGVGNDSVKFTRSDNYLAVSTVATFTTQGNFRLFTLTNDTLVLYTSIDGTDGINSGFGVSFAMNSDCTKLMISASKVNDGVVYCYTRSSDAWTLVSTIISPETSKLTQFGNSIAGDSDLTRVAIGTNSTNAAIQSAIYMYTGSISNMTLGQTFNRQSGVGSTVSFGNNLAMSENGLVLMVGDCTENSYAGSLEMFVYNTTTNSWSFYQYQTPKTRTTSGQYAYAFAFKSNVLLVGEPLSNSGKGQAYVYIPKQSTPVLSETKLTMGVTEVATFRILNYDLSAVYSLAAIAGSVSRNGFTITYTAPSSTGSGGFTLDSLTNAISIV